MKKGKKLIQASKFLVKPGKKVKLKQFDTGYTGKSLDKEQAGFLLDKSRRELAMFQDKFYAHNRHSLLIIFQAMDAAGKDGAVKHVMSGFNPLGVKVYSFKAPNSAELDHHYLWRHMLALPARGEIAIHNRSHYENVLVTKVHPEYILSENLPGVESVKEVNGAFWSDRYKQIRRFEKTLTENGTVIIKFFLHVSKKEQKRRFLERIDDPSKNWKFSMADLSERGHWNEYQKAYEEAMGQTTTDEAPWYIIPADDKWFARLAIAQIISETFGTLKMSYPAVGNKQRAALQDARKKLQEEDPDTKKVSKKS